MAALRIRTPEMFANLRMRTKFLCSLVLVTAALSCTTLLIVRHAAEVHFNSEIEEEVRSAVATFEVIQRRDQIALNHKADLLATLAQIRNGDASAIDESSADPWRSDDCNLLALADRHGRITALHASEASGFPMGTAEEMLRWSLTEHVDFAWWYSGADLYEVVLQPVYEGGPQGRSRAGTVIVGHQIDSREVRDLRAASSSQVVFRYGSDAVVSTFSPLDEQDFERQIQSQPEQEQIRIRGETFLARTVSLTPREHPAVSLTVLKSYRDARGFLDRLNHLLLGLWLLAALAGGAVVYFISDAFTRPLARLSEGVRALEAGDFSYPLEATGGDEVAEVTRAFNRMRATLQSNEAKRQQLETQLRQAQRMEAMGRLAGGVAHDFNNLLTVIKGHSSLLLERLHSADRLTENTKQIAKAADRAASLTRQLLAFSRMQVLQPKVLDLNAVVADLQKMLTRLIREDIKFTFRPAESLGRVKADPSQIEQVLMNLTVNACDAMPHGGNLTIETCNATVDERFAQNHAPMSPGDYVLLSVMDTGQGMDAKTKARIFEPYFTTKEMGKGTGLGLATVYGAVKQSEGFIWVDTEPGKGARFDVYLPRVEQAAEDAGGEGHRAAQAHRKETVLIAEDEEGVRELAAEFLKSAGYRVLTAEDGQKALAISKLLNGPIHVLLTDVVMPNMRGPELAQQVRQDRPDARIIYVSGYLEYEGGNEEFLEDGLFLQKPFSRETLISKVSEALNREHRPAAVVHS